MLLEYIKQDSSGHIRHKHREGRREAGEAARPTLRRGGWWRYAWK